MDITSGRKPIPMVALFLLLILALASIGIGYGLWSKTLTIEGVVRTGSVNSEFILAFTDDDNQVNDPEFDSYDTGDCPITVNGEGSCDPAETGRDPKLHYDKDVGQCFARTLDRDELQPGDQNGLISILNSFPSYHCTAWFTVRNNGSVPVKIVSVKINGESVVPGFFNRFDLTEDDQPDMELLISDIQVCQQIDPGELVVMNVDQHVLQEAPQNARLEYEVSIQLNQWNETPCGLLFAGSDTEEFSGITPPDRLAVAVVEGGVVHDVSIIPVQFDLNGIAPSGYGTLFGGTAQSNVHHEFKYNGDLISSIAGPLPDDSCCSEDLAYDGTHIWRPKYGPNPGIYQYAPDGTLIQIHDPNQADYVGATWDGANLWVTLWAGQSVGTFSPGSGYTPVFGISTNGGGLAFDPVHTILWVGRRGGMVEAYDVTGVPTLIPGSGFQPLGNIPDTIDGLAFVSTGN